MTPALELSGVSKVYPPPTAVTALADVDLVVRAGETVAITGASGSGKSTLAKLVQRLYVPEAGRVMVDGIAEVIQLAPAQPAAAQFAPKWSRRASVAALDAVTSPIRLLPRPTGHNSPR